MHNESQSITDRHQWGEERLRYTILQAVYDKAGGQCQNAVTGSEIGAVLDLRYEDLFRVIHFLEHNEFLEYLGPGPRVCITPKGIRYIEELAHRRRSIRTPDRTFSRFH